MKKEIEGKCIVLGDNIDTDQIYPGNYLELTDPEQIGSHCLAGVDAEISGHFPKGGIVVAGRNFGCGSSREHAPIALLHMGAAAILAESFARIFFRNAINLGLPCIVCKEITQKVEQGQTIRLNLEQGMAEIVETGERYTCEQMGEQAVEILKAGGIKALMENKLKTKKWSIEKVNSSLQD